MHLVQIPTFAIFPPQNDSDGDVDSMGLQNRWRGKIKLNVK